MRITANKQSTEKGARFAKRAPFPCTYFSFFPYDDRREGNLTIYKRGQFLCVCSIYCCSAAAAAADVTAAAAIVRAAARTAANARHPRSAAAAPASVIVRASAVTAAVPSAAMPTTITASMPCAANAGCAAAITEGKGGASRLFSACFTLF